MSKICAIHQPNLLPWIGFFYKILKSDVFVFLDNVDIVTGSASSITNRTTIKTSNGKLLLTAPLKKSESKKIVDIQYAELPWRNKLIRSIEQSYKKAPNFEKFYPIVNEIISYENNNLSDFNINSITKICDYLKLSTEFHRASDFAELSTERNQRIIDLCKQSDCAAYFSGNGAKKYHDEQIFRENQIEIIYTDFVHPEYAQRYDGFEPGLSIIDYLFNISEEENIFLNGKKD